MRRRKVDWGDLPQEILEEIGKRVSSGVDILHFRSVCEQWRASLPRPTLFPLRVPPLPSCGPDTRFYITEFSFYDCKKAHGSLVVEEEVVVDQGAKFSVQTPASFSRKRKSDYMVNKAYHLHMAHPVHKPYANMVIISSNVDDNGVNPSFARASDLCVVACLSGERMRGRLAFLRLGGAPENKRVWNTKFCCQLFEDIATYRGRLCAIDCQGRVFLMDSNTLRMTQVSGPWPDFCEMKSKNLFEAFGDLYLAVFFGGKRSLMGYRLCLRLQKWMEVDIEHDLDLLDALQLVVTNQYDFLES